MSDLLDLHELPKSAEVYMIVGWRQWADAGSISSGLPQYLIQQSGARSIGKIKSESLYLFQIPGTHDLVRPVVKFEQGYPVSMQNPRNEFFFSGDDRRGLVIFIGDEPHLGIEAYTAALLEAAQKLAVKRIVGLGGVYGAFPYDKERSISCTYSLPYMKEELARYAVRFSDYHGGASIDSFLCKRAGEQNIEYLSFYGFVPAYDFSEATQPGGSIRIENDHMAWLAIMQRLHHMLDLEIDLTDLKLRAERLVSIVNEKITELANTAPQLGIHEYLQQISAEYTELLFEPLEDIWEENVRRILDRYDQNEGDSGHKNDFDQTSAL